MEGRASPQSEYQLFVNRKEQICVMQSAAEVPHGRNIKVRLLSDLNYKSHILFVIMLTYPLIGLRLSCDTN